MGIISSIIHSSGDATFLVETATDVLYIVGTYNEIYKSIDKGANWTLIDTRDGAIWALFFDRPNDKLYILNDKGLGNGVGYIDLTNDSIVEIGGQISATGVRIGYDTWIRDGNIEVLIDSNDANDIEIWRWVDPN